MVESNAGREKIDVHIHGALKRIETPGSNTRHPEQSYIADAEELRRHLEQQQIKRAILLSSGEGTSDFLRCANNQECMEICSKQNGFFSWMCNFDPVSCETITDRMKEYKKQGAVGVGELMINEWIDSPILGAIFAAAEQYELPVTAHMSPEPGMGYGICDQWGLPLLEGMLDKHPDLNYVGHSQTFWMELSGDCPKDSRGRNGFGKGNVIPGGRILSLMNQYPNLYADLSAYSGSCAILRDEDFGLEFLENYQDRLLYGTDTLNQHQVFPVGNFLDQVVTDGRLSRRTYEKICFLNAQKLYKL